MFRDNRLVDSSPKSNVHCCDVVRRPSIATLNTSELISSLKHSIEDSLQGIYTFGMQQKYSWSVPNSSRPMKGAGLLGDLL